MSTILSSTFMLTSGENVVRKSWIIYASEFRKRHINIIVLLINFGTRPSFSLSRCNQAKKKLQEQKSKVRVVICVWIFEFISRNSIIAGQKLHDEHYVLCNGSIFVKLSYSDKSVINM